MSMITASTWVPRGAAASFPAKYEIDESELARISKLAKLQLEDAQDDLDHATRGKGDPSESDISLEDNHERKAPQSQGQVFPA